MRRTNVILIGVSIAAVAAALVAGCTSNSASSVNTDQKHQNAQADRYNANQPNPLFDWSQYRQTLIDVESAQANGVATTTFFFNMGVQHPIKVCPSIGFPVASTSQLTNPDQVVWGDNGASGVVAQQEPNGTFTGDSSGTYVVCVASNGTKYISYWEGSVHTEGGAAHWDSASNMIVLDGAPTVTTKAKK